MDGGGVGREGGERCLGLCTVGWLVGWSGLYNHNPDLTY